MEVSVWDIATAAPPSCQQAVISIGNFDGVHKGHAALLRRLKKLQEQIHRPSLVATFDPPPLALLRPEIIYQPLTILDHKLKLLESFRIDHVLVFKTTSALLALAAREFWNNLLIEQLQVCGIVEGSNFYFGHNREGTVVSLRQWCAEQGIPLEIVHDVNRGGQRISSSAIREIIKQGAMDQASRALGRYYSITGKVVRGDQRGKQIGFPTANLTDIPTLIPGTGVYAGLARVREQIYAAAVNIGPNPTFGIQQFKVEAHLLDFQGDLYGQNITLEFISRLRSTQPFASVLALQQQLAQDVAQTKQITLSEIKKRRYFVKYPPSTTKHAPVT